MATTIKLSDDLIAKARHYGKIYSRSAPKQIEFWAKIGRIAEENPDLPYEFIRDILIAREEETIPFEFSESVS
jgi:hypothetical protein